MEDPIKAIIQELKVSPSIDISTNPGRFPPPNPYHDYPPGPRGWIGPGSSYPPIYAYEITISATFPNNQGHSVSNYIFQELGIIPTLEKHMIEIIKEKKVIKEDIEETLLKFGEKGEKFLQTLDETDDVWELRKCTEEKEDPEKRVILRFSFPAQLLSFPKFKDKIMEVLKAI